MWLFSHKCSQGSPASLSIYLLGSDLVDASSLLVAENMSLIYLINSRVHILLLINGSVIVFWMLQTYHKFGDAAFSLTRFFKDKDTGGGTFKPSIAVGIATGWFFHFDAGIF